MAYTNQIRFSGLATGMDTEALVTQLMNAESLRLNRFKRNAITIGWKQEAYRDVRTRLMAFQSSHLDILKTGSMRLSNTFSTKKISVETEKGEASKAVSVGANSKDGTYSVKVEQLAVADMYESKEKVSGDIKPADGTAFDYKDVKSNHSYDVTLDGTTKRISFTNAELNNLGKDSTNGNDGNADFEKLLNDKLKTAFGTDGTDGTTAKIEAKVSDKGVSFFTNGYYSDFSIQDGSYIPSSTTSNNAIGTTKQTPPTDFSIKIEYGTGSPVTITLDNVGSMTKDEVIEALNKKLKETALGGNVNFALTSDGKVQLNTVSLDKDLKITDSGTGAGSMEYLGFTATDGTSDAEVTLPSSSPPSFATADNAITVPIQAPSNKFSIDIAYNNEIKTIELDDVSTMSSKEDVIKALNEKLKEKNLDSNVNFTLTSDGKVQLNALSLSGDLKITDSNDGTGSMKYLGFDDSGGAAEVTLSPPTTSDNAIGMKAQTAPTKFSIDIEYDGKTETIDLGDVSSMDNKAVVKALNDQLKEKGLNSNLNFALTNDGKIQLNAVTLNTELTVKSSSDDAGTSNGSMEYLGFDVPEATLTATSPLSILGIRSGSASKFNVDRTLKEVFGADLAKDSFTINGKSFSVTEDKKLSELIAEVNEADIGVTLEYDEKNAVFRLEAKDTGYVNKINMSGNFLTTNLGFGATATAEAQDSVAVIDGLRLTRSSNEYTFEGVEWSFNRVTTEDLTVTIGRDVDAIVDKIKEFVDSYNSLIDDLRKVSDTPRPKNNGAYYDPLLDEERAELSESQLKLWDENAKTGLLYRDSIITNITSRMRTSLYQSVKLDDNTTISMHEIGITTGDWKEGGKLVIEEDKLRTAIQERGDDIATLFTKSSSNTNKSAKFAEQGLADRLNDIITTAVSPNGTIAEKAGIVGMRSEKDNTLYKQLKAQNDRIVNMISRLEDKEAYYYSMFARMESSVSQANSQISYLQSIAGY